MAHDSLRMLAPHMIVGLGGTRLSDEERSLLTRYPFSGIILFERNVSDARSLMELAQDVRNIFHETRGVTPLIAADHEGGMVSVLGRAIGVPPTQMAVFRAGDPRLCRRLFAENARRMRACGVNMLFGPVADVNSERLNPVIGTRSFGEDVHGVSSLVSEAVSAARGEGLLTCIKHFPGHGPSSIDSHLALPVLGATLEELREKDILPFRSGIDAGTEAVMAGHIAPLGRTLPASLDPGIIGDLLRGELGFKGIVITDALEMEGVKVGGLAEVCTRSLAAGNDILLFSRPAPDIVRELEALGAFWDPGACGKAGPAVLPEASRDRIERLLGIAAMKEREFELPADAVVYGEIAERSIRVTRGPEAAWAFDPSRGFKLAFYSERGAFDRFPMRSFIARLLRGLVAGEDGRPRFAVQDAASLNALEPCDAMLPSASDLECRLFSFSREPDAAVDIAFLLVRRPLSGETVRELCSGVPAVVVAGWPYAARDIPPDKTVFVTFGVYDAAAEALPRILANA
jgi:beta-glucosidase-like glycosyl hydrolase